MRYDWLVVGSGLFGSVFAHEMAKRGKRVLVIERRSHIGGNCYTRNEDGINVHQYGAHIFRTNDRAIWNYVQQFAEFNNFVNSPVANYHGRLYNLPFNMNTFYQIWGLTTPQKVKEKIAEQRREIVGEPRNLEEKAISLVGRDVYEVLVKEYTEKQWGRPCADLPASIIRRLPVRLTFDNNYFNDPYQGIPMGGYTAIFEKMLKGCEVLLDTDYKAFKAQHPELDEVPVLYTGAIDEFFDYACGPLEYRSLRFEHERHDETDNLQGVAVVNYTDKSVPWTRTIEHKHFEFGCQPVSSIPGEAPRRMSEVPFTIVSKEHSFEWHPGVEPYYPVNDDRNQARYADYRQLAAQQTGKVVFGGRLGTYRYWDMQDTIRAALQTVAYFHCACRQVVQRGAPQTALHYGIIFGG